MNVKDLLLRRKEQEDVKFILLLKQTGESSGLSLDEMLKRYEVLLRRSGVKEDTISEIMARLNKVKMSIYKRNER